MIEEPSTLEIVVLFMVNGISAASCSQLHKSIYFLLGLTFWALHFGHYFLTFLFLLVGSFVVSGLVPRPHVTFGQLLPLVLTESLVSVCSCVIHDGGSDGAVHAIRVTDCGVTLSVILGSKYFIDANFYSVAKSGQKFLLIFIAICSAIAWMEPLIYINYKVVIVWPILTVATALHFVMTFQLYQKTKINVQALTMYVSGLTSLVISPFAVIFTSDSFLNDSQDIVTSWELIDYMSLLSASFFVSAMLISKYCLLCKCTPETYAVTRHSKYLVGAFGQWLLQNMAYITLFSLLGKIGALIGIVLYCWRRYRGHSRNNNIVKYHNPVVNGVINDHQPKMNINV